MGEVRVPAHALWRAQTQRAVENFPVSGLPMDAPVVHALARIKAAAAGVNAELGVLPAELAVAIADAAARVAAGGLDDHFPVDVFQTGSGTSTNMNVNEVIASLASEALGEPVHPNDHVNASQSSNDTFPTAVHIAATATTTNDLLPSLEHLRAALHGKAVELAGLVKSGRTHLMDATPVTFGQEFGGYAAGVARCAQRLRDTLPRLAELPLGGTAVGTGINTPPGFAAAVISRLAEQTGLPLTEAADHFEAQGSRDGLVELSGQLRGAAVTLYKIANDIRWMGSGPRAGLGELRLPDLQPGSSIMPGKVNPVICEAVRMVAAQVIGNDATVGFAGSQGDFELNVMIPVLAHNVLESVRLLSNVARLFADRCITGLTADAERAAFFAASSPAIVTGLNRYLGYENAAAVAKAALAQGRTIREVVVESGYVERGVLTESELDAALDPAVHDPTVSDALEQVAQLYRACLPPGRLGELRIDALDRTGVPVVAADWDGPGQPPFSSFGYGRTGGQATVGGPRGTRGVGAADRGAADRRADPGRLRRAAQPPRRGAGGRPGDPGAACRERVRRGSAAVVAAGDPVAHRGAGVGAGRVRGMPGRRPDAAGAGRWLADSTGHQWSRGRGHRRPGTLARSAGARAARRKHRRSPGSGAGHHPRLLERS